MIKRLVIALILIVVVAGGIVGFNFFRAHMIKQYFATMEKPKLTVSTTVAEPITWTPEIEAIGTVRARSGVDLTVEEAGVVRNIAFQSNEKVKEGQLLVQLDDAVQRANLEAEKAQAALDQQNLERAIELQKRQVGAQANVQQTQAAASASAAQVDSLQAILNQKRLTAPFNGTIGIPQIDVGQYLTPGDVVATLQDLDTMRADFTVPEQQLPDLKIDQKVRLGLTGDELKFEGKIIGIDPKVDPSTRLVSVRAEIYIVVPADENGKATTGKVDPKNKDQNLVARQIFVKIGRRSEGRIEIKDGVKPGDVVVNAGQNRLTNGAAVTIDNSVQPGQVQEAGSQ